MSPRSPSTSPSNRPLSVILSLLLLTSLFAEGPALANKTTDLWIGVRPEAAVFLLGTGSSVNSPFSGIGFFVPRFELGIGGRTGQRRSTRLDFVLDVGPILASVRTQGSQSFAAPYLAIDAGILVQKELGGKRVDWLGGGRFTFDFLVSSPETNQGSNGPPVFPLFTVGGSFGFVTRTRGVAFRLMMEPGVVLPLPTPSFALSFGVDLL